MDPWIDVLAILVMLVNLKLLGSSRLLACVRVVAVQGILLGMLPLLLHAGDAGVRMWLTAAASVAFKGVAFPWLLARAVREADVRREVEPIVGYTLSLAAGAAMLGASIWLARRLPLPFAVPSALIVPTALFTLAVGMFIIVSRRKAVTQVLGYLAMENGIYTFGMTFAEGEPLLVELGILLDVFVAVFVMGITIYHINREFDHIDTDRMSVLKG
jgi:hydrogenase-4 component E